MSWFFAIFFGLVVLCALAWLGMQGRELFAPKQTARVETVKRYSERFPYTVGFFRRDRKDLHLVFRLEDGRELDITVPEEVYAHCPVGTKGVLTWQGHRFDLFDEVSEDIPL